MSKLYFRCALFSMSQLIMVCAETCVCGGMRPCAEACMCDCTPYVMSPLPFPYCTNSKVESCGEVEFNPTSNEQCCGKF